jgi:hypothetical protein
MFEAAAYRIGRAIKLILYAVSFVSVVCLAAGWLSEPLAWLAALVAASTLAMSFILTMKD